MELYKIDPVNERSRKLNEVAQKIYKEAGLLAATAHLLGELAQNKDDVDFDQLRFCRHLLQEKAATLDKFERELHKLDEDESIGRRDYQNGRLTYQWKD
jgi:hypothetical protein